MDTLLPSGEQSLARRAIAGARAARDLFMGLVPYRDFLSRASGGLQYFAARPCGASQRAFLLDRNRGSGRFFVP